MEGGQIKDFMNALIGAFIMIFPLVREINKKKKGGMEYALIIFYAIIFVFLVWLGTDKIVRDNNTQKEANTKIDSLETNIDELKKLRKIDSTNKAYFDSTLLKKFDIRDSSGVPVGPKYLEVNVNTMRDMFFNQY